MKIKHCDILLRGLRFYAYHGVLEQERRVGGHYTIDLTLRLTDAAPALNDDDLGGTVNYAEVYELVRREMAIPSALLEHAAARILRVLFAAYPRVASAVITLRKDTPPMGADSDGCAVRLEAER